MPTATIHRSTKVRRTPRVMQLEGIFDLPPARRSDLAWSVDLPTDEREWNIGLIVGPSGSGKSTIARELFGPAVVTGFDWPADQSIVDGFPADLGIREIAALLSSVGFSSPPSWLRPFHVLSTGEQFRVTLARGLAESAVGASTPSPPLPPDRQTSCRGEGWGEGAEAGHMIEQSRTPTPHPARFARHPLPQGERGLPPPTAHRPLLVIDEFTSVVDRTVARLGSAAVAKAVRRRGLRFVAVTCHYDVTRWLAPDWIYEPATNRFSWRRLRRPRIALEVRRCTRRAWETFKRHHYLSASLSPSAQCFVGLVAGQPAVFTAAVHFPHPSRSGWREHRTVCRPDFQGVGLGNAMSEFVASLFCATGKPYRSVTSNPAMIHHRARSPLWRMTRAPSRMARNHLPALNRSSAADRLTASFEYIGPARVAEARAFDVIE